MFNTPVLLLVFNRLETSQKVFESIRSVKPKRLFIAADGPRPDRIEDIEKTKLVRNIIEKIDWDCDLKTLFRTENLGPGKGPANAITWFFEHVEDGIILEDDCLPSLSFFFFCEILLEKFRHDERVQSIAGTNQFINWETGGASYMFAKQAGIWGWATWRRAWKEYDFHVQHWGNPYLRHNFLNKFSNATEKDNYTRALNKAYSKQGITWWDYQWIFSRVISSRVGIVPKINLISNIGFGTDASHTFNKESVLASLPIFELTFPLVHPASVVIDSEFDEKHSNTFYPILKKSHGPLNMLKRLYHGVLSRTYIKKLLK